MGHFLARHLFVIAWLGPLWLFIGNAAPINILGYVPDAEDSYFSLSEGLTSALRLAVEDVNAHGTILNGTLNLTLVPTNGVEITALREACVRLKEGNGAFGAVGPLRPSDASLLASASSSYAALPLVTYGAPTATDDIAGESRSYLFQVQPDAYAQMTAMANLIVEMKAARDNLTDTVWPEENIGVVTVGEYGKGALDILESVVLDFSTTNKTENFSIKQSASIAEDAISSIVAADITGAVTAMKQFDISIIVVLAEGNNAGIVRELLHEAQSKNLLSEEVQWYFADGVAFDGVFDVNSTYRNTQLAYDMRGSLGLRPCYPSTGAGSEAAAELTEKWGTLNPAEYPGAGELLVDSRLEPMYAYAYDSVMILARAIGDAQIAAGGAHLLLPFSENCLIGNAWAQGGLVEEALLESEYNGTTGYIHFENARRDDGTGATANHRSIDHPTFCAVNLVPHEDLGATFSTFKTWTRGDEDGFLFVNKTTMPQVFPQEALSYPPDRPTLVGKSLNILTQNGTEPMVFIETHSNGSSTYSGVNINYLDAMAADRGFTYTMHHIPNNQSSQDILDEVAEGKYDMGIGTLTITSNLVGSNQFSYPYYDQGMVFVIHANPETAVNVWKVFTPFAPEVWIAIMVTLVVVVWTFWLFEASHNDDFTADGAGYAHEGERKVVKDLCSRWVVVLKNLSKSLYITYALLVGQLAHKPETLEGYIVTVGWLFVCFIFGATYTANLASFLTISGSFSDTVTVSKLQTGRVAHSEVVILEGSVMETIYQREVMFCDTNCAKPFQSCLTIDECLTMVRNDEVLVAFMDQTVAQYKIASNFCDLELLSDVLSPSHYGIVLPSETPFLDEIQEVTLRLRESGVIVDSADNIFTSGDCIAELGEDEDLASTSVEDISGVLVIMTFFVAAGYVVYFIRLCRNFLKYRKDKRIFEEQEEEKEEEKEEETIIRDNILLSKGYRMLSRSQRKRALYEHVFELVNQSELQSAGYPGKDVQVFDQDGGVLVPTSSIPISQSLDDSESPLLLVLDGKKGVGVLSSPSGSGDGVVKSPVHWKAGSLHRRSRSVSSTSQRSGEMGMNRYDLERGRPLMRFGSGSGSARIKGKVRGPSPKEVLPPPHPPRLKSDDNIPRE